MRGLSVHNNTLAGFSWLVSKANLQSSEYFYSFAGTAHTITFHLMLKKEYVILNERAPFCQKCVASLNLKAQSM